jgi:endonuclease YncB( thermonuclease family)
LLTRLRDTPVRRLDAVGAVLVLIVLVAALVYLETPPEQVAGAVRVIDGDTIKVAGHTVRLAGMDAPELAQTCLAGGQTLACGLLSRAKLAALVTGATTTCRIVGHDRYRRDLGRCDVAGRDIGATLVSEGLAVAYGAYAREEGEARDARRGLWAGTFERPADWRKAHPRGGPGDILP